MTTLDLVDRYLGPSIDIGPALMAKIIKENGQVLHGSIYQALSPDENKQEQCKNKLSLFMESLHQELGPYVRLSNLVELGVKQTPQYDPYQDTRGNVNVGGTNV
jgi:hypothetical protein